MLTKSQAAEVVRKAREELEAFVDANTRPRSTAAAAFSKRQAADIKAGMRDGTGTALRALLAAGAFEGE